MMKLVRKCKERWLAPPGDQAWKVTFSLCTEDGWQGGLGQEGLKTGKQLLLGATEKQFGERRGQTDGLERCSLQQYSWGILVLRGAFLKSQGKCVLAIKVGDNGNLNGRFICPCKQWSCIVEVLGR